MWKSLPLKMDLQQGNMNMTNDPNDHKPDWGSIFFNSGLALIFLGTANLLITFTTIMNIWLIIFGICYIIASITIYANKL